MKNKFKKFKNDYLQNINERTNKSKNIIKSKIINNDMNSENDVTKQPEQTRKYKSLFIKNPLAYGLGIIIIFLTIFITSTKIVDYKNTPVYRGMTASRMVTNRDNEVKSRANRSRYDRFGSNKLYIDKSEEEVLDEIGIIYLPGISCYAKPSEKVIITI